MTRPLLVCAVLGLLVGCTPPPKPLRTQLEIREFETREFDERDPKKVMKSLVNVLQDEGFIVKNAVVDLGLITAVREMDLEDANSAFFHTLFMGEEALWAKNAEIEVSLNATGIRDGTRVRANFQRKVLNNRGGVVSIEHIDDGSFYMEFFSKVDKGLFLEREHL